MKTRQLTWTLFLLVAITGFVMADSWPQWRGPVRNGISQETGLLQEWPTEGPKLVWHVKQIGSGYSTPAVVGETLYLLGNEGLDNEYVKALRVQDGSEIWSIRIGKVGNPDQRPAYPAARSTPTVDGDFLFVLGSDGDLACLERASGTIRWQKNVRTEFSGKPGEWAYSESPLIDGEVLICTPGGSEATMVALNKQSGELIWKCAVPEGSEAGYASAIVVEDQGMRQYVQFLATGLVGVNAETGELLWKYDQTAERSPANIATPMADNGYVYSAAGRSGGGLVKLQVDQRSVEAEQVYFSGTLPSGIGGVVKLGDYFYGTKGDSLLCVEFTTGEIQWQDRGIGAASLCYADGRLYLHGENGDVALVEPSPEGYREKGRFTPPDQPDRGRSKAWAYPVVADGKLYIRDLDSLWCYEVKP